MPLSPPAKAAAYGRTEGLMAGALAAHFGRRFWLRTLISSGFSEIVLCTVAYFILFSGLRSLTNIIQIIYSVWSYKMFISILINPIITRLAHYLKNYEHSDVYDHGISYNPYSKINNSVIEFTNELKPNISASEAKEKRYLNHKIVLKDRLFSS